MLVKLELECIIIFFLVPHRTVIGAVLGSISFYGLYYESILGYRRIRMREKYLKAVEQARAEELAEYNEQQLRLGKEPSVLN